MRKGFLALLVAALITALSAASASAAEEMVALGDSYAAGPLIPAPLPPFGCLKSSNNYGRLAATQLGASPYRDATCSGAETEDMTAPQGVSPRPNPPQFDRLTASTTLVTITIGGNDIGFSGIAQDCFSQSNSGTPCRDKYAPNWPDPAGPDEISQRIADTRPKVDAVLQGIHSRSPNARVLVVNYAQILPEAPPYCWPVVPISDGDAPYVSAKERELNQMLADSAAANGATLVDWYAASIGHDACKPPGIKWVEGAVPTNAAAPLHPNLLGMIGAANIVVAAARAG